MIIDGKKIAEKIYNDLEKQVKTFKKKPCLGAILVGNNPASERYIRQKQKFAQKIGINFELKRLDENITEEELLKEINNFNLDKNISGYIVQLPLPKSINEINIINNISPKKDVDSFHPENQGKLLIGDESSFIPCTPAGIIEILNYLGEKLSSKIITVIGRSNIVGKPITNLLINAGATVISCNSKTPDISEFTKKSDIIILAAGSPGLLKKEMIKKDAIIIDVGFTIIDNKIYGDACFEEIEKAGNKITPVPGGVGALTVAMLMKNTIKAYRMENF